MYFDSHAHLCDEKFDSDRDSVIARMAENGVTGGVGNGFFAPESPCTRAQIITFLYRAYLKK